MSPERWAYERLLRRLYEEMNAGRVWGELAQQHRESLKVLKPRLTPGELHAVNCLDDQLFTAYRAAVAGEPEDALYASIPAAVARDRRAHDFEGLVDDLEALSFDASVLARR